MGWFPPEIKSSVRRTYMGSFLGGSHELSTFLTTCNHGYMVLWSTEYSMQEWVIREEGLEAAEKAHQEWVDEGVCRHFNVVFDTKESEQG